MQGFKAVSTQMDHSKLYELTRKLPVTQDEAKEMDNVPYREAIGSLMYVSITTRPDIATAVNILNRHV